MTIGPVTRFDYAREAHFRVPLPNNNLPLVFVPDTVLRAIFDHAAEAFPLEIGGYCLGLPLVDHSSKAKATFIEEVVRAIGTSTRTHITMHPETFHLVEQRRAVANNLLVGYYHSHPALSVFQSPEDVSNFRMYHPEDYQIAIVADSSLAKANSLDLHEPWIGFFAWDAAHNPEKLPPENLFVMQSEKPAFTMVRNIHDGAELGTTAKTIKRGFRRRWVDMIARSR
jgi:proteasome lid subunit RPN8/RPN11